MATGITLIKQAIYGVVPNLLAKGNMLEEVHSENSFFPTYCNGVPQTKFTLEKAAYPYGYDPAGYLRFEGRENSSTVMRCRNMQIPSNGQGSAVTIYVDMRANEPAYDYDIPVSIRNPEYYVDGHKKMSVGFCNFPMGMYSNRQAADIISSPYKSTRYEFDISYGGYPQRMQRTVILQSSGAITHKLNQEAHKYVSPNFTYPDAFFTDMDIGAQDSWGYLCGRINCILIWPRALHTDELNWLHSAGQQHFDGIIANHIGNYAVDIVSGTATTSYPAPRAYTATTFPPAPKTGKALLEDAIYGILPQLLAKGNKTEPQRTGAFPVYYRPDVRKSHFWLFGDERNGTDLVPEGYGYRPDAGGSDVKGFIAFDGVECRIWNWRANVPAGHCTIWVDIEGEICNETWSGGGPFGVPLRFGEEGSEIKNPTTDLMVTHTDTELRVQMYDTGERDVTHTQFPTRYTMALGIEGSGSRKVFRQVNGGSSSTISNTFNNNFGLYRIFDIGARRSWGYFKGRIRTILIFSRLLFDEELTWLHENSLAGFPGLWANQDDYTVTIYDSATTTPAPETTEPPATTAPPPVPAPSYSLYKWSEPRLWDSRRAVLSNDFNFWQTNLKYLKQSLCQTFYLGGKTGVEKVLPARDYKTIGLILKRVPPKGRIYLTEVSRMFQDGILALQLEAGVHPHSPSYNAEFFPCPEIGNGSFNRTDETDAEKNDYRWVTRWSSPVNSSEPEGYGAWFYGDGHLLVVNHSTTYILVTLNAVIRNLTSDKEHTSSYEDYARFTFTVTGEDS